MTESVAPAQSQVRPTFKTAVVVCTVVVAVAGAVHLIWGKVGLICYGGLLFVAYQFKGPAIRIWRHVELKGVLIAVAAAAFPMFGYSGAIGGGYLAICIAGYQWRQIQTIHALEELHAAQKGQNAKLQEFTTTFTAGAQRIEKQLLTATEGSEALRQALEAIKAANQTDTEAVLRQWFLRMEVLTNGVVELQKAIKQSPVHHQLQKVIEEWQTLTLRAKEQLETITAEREKLTQEREKFEKQVARHDRTTRRSQQITQNLEQIVTT